MSTAAKKTTESKLVIKFIDLNVSNFIAYLENSDIDENQVIDFTKDKIVCKAHPQDKTLVKYTAISAADILKYDALPETFKLLKFPIYRIAKILDALKIFKDSKVDKLVGEIVYEIDGDKSFIGLSMKLASKGLRITIKAMDYYLASHMDDAIWEKLSERGDFLIKFDAKRDFMQKLISLCSLNEGGDGEKAKEKLPAFKISLGKENQSLVFSSKKDNGWAMKYDVEDGNKDFKAKDNVTLVMSKKMLKMMTATFYDVYIVYNQIAGQHILVAYQDDNNIMLNALLEYDPNEK